MKGINSWKPSIYMSGKCSASIRYFRHSDRTGFAMNCLFSHTVNCFRSTQRSSFCKVWTFPLHKPAHVNPFLYKSFCLWHFYCLHTLYLYATFHSDKARLHHVQNRPRAMNQCEHRLSSHSPPHLHASCTTFATDTTNCLSSCASCAAVPALTWTSLSKSKGSLPALSCPQSPVPIREPCNWPSALSILPVLISQHVIVQIKHQNGQILTWTFGAPQHDIKEVLLMR